MQNFLVCLWERMRLKNGLKYKIDLSLKFNYTTIILEIEAEHVC
ncbi:hypothetical protein SAMN02745220_05365 [Desulfopila aestuarii DSM 18488]|uniref:Uncharacterized protein n=1 Tax=Desulfopila aestuarii DSM 18488 TaxID=1121416 RepID=A0A1M7YMX6_9BACT|nr:hypothetical protein SAMN02745220_05365 [Desulfopila aestuarii DSM 18488]